MKKAADLLVKFTRRQAINFAGRTLRSVYINDDMLVVHRKMYRGRFALCYYPLDQVISYQEGDGGKDGTAYAIVMDEVVLKTIQGKGIVDGETGLIKILDENDLVHYMNMGADSLISVSIIELDPEEAEEAPVPKRRGRPPAVVEEEPEADEEEIPTPSRGSRRVSANKVASRTVGKVNRASSWDNEPRRGSRRNDDEF
jgi:hypothetical protein